MEESTGTVVYYTYDKNGNLTQEITTDKTESLAVISGESSRRVVNYSYSPTGEMTEIGSGTGETEKYEYYQDGTLARTISPSGKTIDYTYDTWGNLIRIDHEGEVNVKRTYDGQGQLIQTVDSTGTTDYTWDKAGRLTTVTNNGKTIGYEYDAYGNLLNLSYPDGSKVSYTYNDLDQMMSMTERDQTRVEYTYDKNGNLLTESRSDGIVTTNAYDILDRMVSTETVQGETTLSKFAYTYDTAGRMIQEESEDELGTLSKTYTYSDDGKLTGYEEKQDGTWAKTIHYTYDTFGNKTGETIEEHAKPLSTITYTYDLSDRLQSKKENGVQTGSYQYDEDGNLVSKTENGVVTSYTYTVDNRMATTTVNGVLENAVTYDGNGLKSFELLRKEYEADRSGDDRELLKKNGEAIQEWVDYHRSGFVPVETTEEGTEGYTQERSAGRNYDKTIFRIAYVVGALAPTLWEEWFDFACTFYEDIRELFHVPGSEDKTTVVVGSQAEDFTALMEYVAEPQSKWTGDSYSYTETVSYYEPTSYLYDLTLENAQVLAEYAGTSTQAKETYNYGADGRSSGAQAGVYIYDGRGSVSETVKAGKVTNTLRYDPYGSVICGAPKQDRIYAYNGEQYTPQTGLIYLRARNYDPATGTFTSRDTYLGDQLNPVTRNRYTYANNNPVMYQDPSGHAGLFSRIVKAVVNVVKKVVQTVAKAVTKPKASAVRGNTGAASAAAKAAASAIRSVTSSRSSSSSSSRSTSGSTRAGTSSVLRPTYSSMAVSATKNSSPLKSSYSSGSGYSYSSGSSSYAGSSLYYTAQGEEIIIPSGVLRYDTSNVKIPQVKVYTPWEFGKDVLETVYRGIMAGEKLVQTVKKWWNDEDSEHYKVVQEAKESYASWKNSKIGQVVTATAKSTLNVMAATISPGLPALYAAMKFREEHPKAANIIAGAGLLITGGAGLYGLYASGGSLTGLVGAAAKEGAKYGGIGAIIGAPVGGLVSSYNYMKEHGTIDGSTEEVLKGMAGGGLVGGGIGFSIGFDAGGEKYLNNLGGYCFIAGTLILTTLGAANIEDICAGDYVYAKDEETGEQKYMPVLETYAREVSETYTVTIEGESIETTANHPFYKVDEGWISAGNLETGDKVELSDGSSGEVESVERNELEEPVTVYNFCVMDYDTYYVGESEVFVHNCKAASMADDAAEAAAKSGTDTTRVGRWMSQDEYDKMVASGKVQMSGDNKVHVANPADINAFGKQAPKGSLYVEFDVPSNTVSKGGTDGWGIINGPGSLIDRLNAKKGLPRITEMPNATNITIGGSK